MSQGIDRAKMEQFLHAVAQVLPLKAEGGMSTEEKAKMFRAIADDQSARTDYIQSRADLVLPLLPTQSTVRRIFKEDPLPDGVRQTGYPINFRRTQMAFIAPGVGAVPQQLLEGDEIFIPPLTLDGSVAFPMRYARDGRFSIGENATKELKDQIIYQEEFVGWKTIQATISGVLGAQTLGTAGTFTEGQPNLFGELTLSGVNKMITKADGYQRKITDLYMSPTRYGNIRDWTTPQIDYFTQREIFKDAGPAAHALYGVGLNKVYDSTLLGDGEVYGFDTSSFGLMPIVQALQTYEDPTAIKEWKIGILGREEVGFGVMDSWAIIRLRLDND